MSGQPFSLFKRGKFYYAQFKDQSDQFATAVSSRKTTKGEAMRWAVEKMKEGAFFVRDKVTFGAYSRSFFNDDGRYAINKRNSGKRLSPQHLHERRRMLDPHVNPFFKDHYLQDIRYRNLEEFRNLMFAKGYAGQTVVKALQTVYCILKDACKYEMIVSLPLIPECSTQVVTPRGCLTVEEIRTLFIRGIWNDQRIYVMCLLAASTGLRLGEIQGLVVSDLHLDEGYLVCGRSYDHRLRKLNQTTKNGRARHIVLSSKVIDSLRMLMNLNPYNSSGESFVFWSDILSDKPMERNAVIRGFKNALASIGIREEDRRTRNIVFHSFRHFCNSFYVNSRLPLHKIQNQIGHLSNEMTERYYHVTMQDLGEVRQVQEGLFGS